MVVDDAFDTFLEVAAPKIDQQPKRQVHQPEVGQQLLGVNRGEMLDGL